MTTKEANKLYRKTLIQQRGNPHVKAFNTGHFKFIWDERNDTREPFGSYGGFMIHHRYILNLQRFGKHANGWHLRQEVTAA